jgi:hypothetical protein
MGQASNQYVTPTDITDVFSTYLYTGAGGTGVVVDNGIDLAGEGGLVWIKARNAAEDHVLFDTERGVTKLLESNTTLAEQTNSGTLTNFYSDGFRVDGNGTVGSSTDPYASWSFRKAPKFFDCVTWSGDGVAGREISHNLGTTVGSIFIKQTTGTNNWIVYHRGANGGVNPEQYNLYLNLTNAQEDFILFNDTAPTDTNFTVGGYAAVNGSGNTYVAYLFAHNDGDGGFGPDNSDIIKCGSYAGNESSFPTVDLGFEPQFLLLKSATSAENWHLIDTTRGFLADGTNSSGDYKYLWADSATSEGGGFGINVTSTGFELTSANAHANSNGNTFIYMAIRRGPLAQPESGTEVFDIDTRTGSLPSYVSTFPVDMAIRKLTNVATNWNIGTRLRGTEELETNTTVAAGSDNDFAWDYMEGYGDDGNAASSDLYSWMWKRAPGYFDVVTYSGNSTNNRELKHNLNVIPEMVWFKSRSDVKNWHVYTAATGNTITGTLNEATLFEDNSAGMASSPTASSIFLKNSNENNGTGLTYIAYLFATVAGVSKVGSVSHTSGSATNVDCGFTSGARFILLKVTDSSGSWFVYDTARGIVAGNDARLKLDSTAAENTGNDDIDPLSSGFTITSTVSTGSYIFYAIA